jgi:hypothetical protein
VCVLAHGEANITVSFGTDVLSLAPLGTDLPSLAFFCHAELETHGKKFVVRAIKGARQKPICRANHCHVDFVVRTGEKRTTNVLCR